MRYRRHHQTGASYFFTVVTEQRQLFFTEENQVQLLRNAFHHLRKRRPFQIDAIVVLPDHLHCIWTLPLDDSDYATRWRLIKTYFTKNLLNRPAVSEGRQKKNQQNIWQHRYWEHCLRDDIDLQNHIDYIHFNPVKHGLVTSPASWPYSSFSRFVKAGIYSEDWTVTNTNHTTRRSGYAS